MHHLPTMVILQVLILQTFLIWELPSSSNF
jgi:hypothetical protein